ncbi:MAG: hypothetical protein FJ216_03820 [Ignavibacteria bacterium]|nr:hypothetical protein [Ignavibacteria bacterium]
MRTKQVRPDKLDFEYELHLSREFDSVLKKYYLLFDFRTVKVFEFFIYKINVKEKILADKNEIHFNIEGLSAPILSLSKSGFAAYQYKLLNFKNSEYIIVLTKKRANKNIFRIKINPKNIKLISQSPKRFIKLIIV